MFAKAAIFFFALVVVANATPQRLSCPLSVIFSCLRQLQPPTWRSATAVSTFIQGVALSPNRLRRERTLTAEKLGSISDGLPPRSG